MPFSFHCHSGQFCKHGAGLLEDVILNAIEVGYEVLGLSEHVPRFLEQHLYPEEMDVLPADLINTFQAYLKEAKILKTKYKSKINLLIGAETEYLDPTYLLQLAPILKASHLDYLVGSVHHVNSIPIDFDQENYDLALSQFGNNHDYLQIAYFDAQFELINQLKPDIIGHFDLIRLFAPSQYRNKLAPEVLSKVIRNIELVIEYGGLFELNVRGIKKGLGSPYPLKDISELIVRLGGRFTLGDDAHKPEEIAMNYHKVPEYLEALGITTLYYLTKKDNKIHQLPIHNIKNHQFFIGVEKRLVAISSSKK